MASGRRIELSGVGGSKTEAYVHELPARLGPGFELPIPFAIATVETVPNLLGRLGVFDRLQVDFDATLEQTRITAPWLDPAERRIWEFLTKTDERILSKWDDIKLEGRAKEAARRMIKRASQLLTGFALCVQGSRGDLGSLFTRALFEVAIQFEYMFQDPINRGKRYLEFENISRYREQKSWLSAKGGKIATMLQDSPLRAGGEQQVNEEYEKVAQMFRKKKGKGTLQSWHGLQVRQLAKSVGREDEYELWYASFSGWIHADPFHIKDEPLLKNSDWLLFSFSYYARMLIGVSSDLVLTSEEYTGLSKLAKKID